ncbi:MAG: hypothetical protein WKF87_11345 [Chryseolinea sp.]
MKLEKFNCDLMELTIDETLAITGGESLWYWPSFVLGRAIRLYGAFLDGARYSYKTMPGLK